MTKVVSEGKKAEALLTLHKDEVGTKSYSFIQFTVGPLSKQGKLGHMTEKQQTWFDDLWDQHFNPAKDYTRRNDGS